MSPKLHFCEHIIGDLYMVVMDRVDGTSAWQFQQDKKPVPAVVLNDIKDALHILHAKDIVFGDLRDPNILYLASKARAILGRMEKTDTWRRPTLAMRGQRTFRHIVLCARPMIHGNWIG